jgi:hypothetical protein
MNKKKVRVVKDKNNTLTRNRYGTSYNKESILQTSMKSLKDLDINDLVKEVNKINLTYNVGHIIAEHERIIKNFIRTLDIDVEDKALLSKLKHNHFHHKGVTQAGSCLFEIQCCRSFLEKENYKAACSNLARLVIAYTQFCFAIFEPVISKGHHVTTNFINQNTKLTEAQYEKSFLYFESLEATIKGQGPIGRKWQKTIKYIKQHFGVEISDRTLRDRYKVWKSR